MEEGENNTELAKRKFYVIVERDQHGPYVGEVPQLSACYSQGQTLDELMANITEVVELCLQEEEDEPFEFIELQRVVI